MRSFIRCLTAAGIVLFTVALGAAPAWAGGGCHQPMTDAAGVRVDIASLCFSPTVIRVRPGTTVAWTNRDGVEHTVTAAGDAFDSTLQDGQAFSQRFGASGTFPYYCRFHPGMVGVVVVGDGRPAAQAAGQVTNQVAVPVGHGGRSGWSELTIGGLVLGAALVSLGAWRSLQAGRTS